MILHFWDNSGVRDNDGRKLDHTTLEVMRLRAVDAVEGGTHPEDVADALGMARGTVYGWLATYREGGREALRARPVPQQPLGGDRGRPRAAGRPPPQRRRDAAPGAGGCQTPASGHAQPTVVVFSVRVIAW